MTFDRILEKYRKCSFSERDKGEGEPSNTEMVVL